MKTLIISSLAVVLLAGGAVAQAPGDASGVRPDVEIAPAHMTLVAMNSSPDAPPPPPPGGPEGRRPPPPPGGPDGRRPPPPPPSRAAHFRLEQGDTSIDVKCADDESMKVCADLTLQMLDKLQALSKR